MVKNVPHVNVTHEYAFVNRVLDTDQTMGCVIECKKGTPNVPVYVTGPALLKEAFGVDMDAYWAAGGGPFWGVRAAYGDVTAAIHYLLDNAATPAKVAKIVSLMPGTNKIYITFTSSGSGVAQRLSLTIEEEDGKTEYYLNVRRSVVPDSTGTYKSALQNLVEKVNNQSTLVNIYFQGVTSGSETGAAPSPESWEQELGNGQKVYVGSQSYKNVMRTVLGSGTGNTAGSDGSKLKTLAEQKEFDIIDDMVMGEEAGADAGSSPSEVAHAEALKALEQKEIAGIFCLKSIQYEDETKSAPIEGVGDIYQPYVDHVTKMNTPEQHGWRFAVVGADENMNMMERIKYAAALNNELMIFVAGGIVDTNGVEYQPRMATMAVAGKIAATKYSTAIWGGRPNKALMVNGSQFITDIIDVPGEPIYEDPDAETLVITGSSPATRTEMIAYNECGCVTFLKDDDGVKITEGVTTVQERYAELGIKKEDEIAVMRIINHAKYTVYDACYSMLGENLNETFQSDLEEAIRSNLGVMGDEGALSAYDVVVTVGTTTESEQGQILAEISITPIHAARIIDAKIVVY